MDQLTAQPNTLSGGKRKWQYPAVRKGKLYQYRSLLSYVYLVLFFAGPFLRIGGHPLLLINIIERRFVILGQVFWPQDFFVFVLAMLVALVCIILFTIAFGRIFCGWICPQTIFMEMLFRKIEIWIEGDHRKRQKLDAGPLTRDKFIKKTAKHAIFLLLSFLIANTFLAYIIGSEALISIMTEPVQQHVAGFVNIWIFTLAFYLVYSQMRELVCTVACPYGRLQGVLTDKHTLVVAYNYLRGEPRGKRQRQQNENAKKTGDCVDCSLCVDVCPTGIDIRKGTQLECVSCTACIDACNAVMEKINRPLNLIGYYSEDTIAQNQKFKFTPRMMAYSAIIVVLMGILTAFIVRRSAVDVTILRAAGTIFQEQPGGYISNLYNVEFINKTNVDEAIQLVPVQKNVLIKYVQPMRKIKAESEQKAILFLIMPAGSIAHPKNEIEIKVMQGSKEIDRISTSFIGPVYAND